MTVADRLNLIELGVLPLVRESASGQAAIIQGLTTRFPSHS